MRQFSGCGRKIKGKTTMRFLEKTIQEVAKVDLRIQEFQVHAGKRNFIESNRILASVSMTNQGPRPIQSIVLVLLYVEST